MSIEFERISFAYKTGGGALIPALNDISLSIKKGEFVGIMGRSGCGKTTFVRLMAGLAKPTSGRVLFDGGDINAKHYDRGELRRKVGVVFQHPERQLFETTVERDVAFGLKCGGLHASEIRARVTWALEVMGFSSKSVLELSPLALSGGERRRVAIAGVLAARPEILLFDEPIAGLHPSGRESFLKTVSELHREGTTVVMVSHNLDALGEYAERLLVLDDGKLLMDGSVREIFSDPERLKAFRLSANTPGALSDMLRRKGIALPRPAVTYRELLSGLTIHFSKGGAP